MSNQITLSDSLKAQGFNVTDLERVRYIVGISAEVNDKNLGDMEPLQTEFGAYLDRLPKIRVEDADGNETFKVDEESDAYVDFMGVAKEAATDRLTFSKRYCHTFAKVPAPGTGALMWVNVATLRDEDDRPINIDPAQYRVYHTTGAVIDPRVRLKLDDSDLMAQVIKPLRLKFKQARNTALSRLRTRARGGASRTQDFGKRLARIEDVIRKFYAACKTEEFNVGTDAALKSALIAVRKVCGLGAK